MQKCQFGGISRASRLSFRRLIDTNDTTKKRMYILSFSQILRIGLCVLCVSVVQLYELALLNQQLAVLAQPINHAVHIMNIVVEVGRNPQVIITVRNDDAIVRQPFGEQVNLM